MLILVPALTSELPLLLLLTIQLSVDVEQSPSAFNTSNDDQGEEDKKVCAGQANDQAF